MVVVMVVVITGGNDRSGRESGGSDSSCRKWTPQLLKGVATAGAAAKDEANQPSSCAESRWYTCRM